MLNEKQKQAIRELKVVEIESQKAYIVSRLKANKRFIQVDFNSKSVKMTFSKEAMNKLNRVYTLKAHFSTIEKKVRAEINSIKKLIENTSSNEKAMSLEKDLLNKQAFLIDLRAFINEELSPYYNLVSASFYQAYRERFISTGTFKKELCKFLQEFNIAFDSSQVNPFLLACGCKSTSSTKWSYAQVEDLSEKEFKRLIVNVLLQMALDKKCLSPKVIEQILTEGSVKINEKGVIVCNNFQATKKDCLAILKKVGYETKNSDKLDNLRYEVSLLVASGVVEVDDTSKLPACELSQDKKALIKEGLGKKASTEKNR